MQHPHFDAACAMRRCAFRTAAPGIRLALTRYTMASSIHRVRSCHRTAVKPSHTRHGMQQGASLILAFLGLAFGDSSDFRPRCITAMRKRTELLVQGRSLESDCRRRRFLQVTPGLFSFMRMALRVQSRNWLACPQTRKHSNPQAANLQAAGRSRLCGDKNRVT